MIATFGVPLAAAVAPFASTPLFTVDLAMLSPLAVGAVAVVVAMIVDRLRLVDRRQVTTIVTLSAAPHAKAA